MPSSPRDFEVGSAPAPAGYAGRLIDFSALSTLGADYYAGQQARRNEALATAFPDGVPTIGGKPLDEGGVPDFNAIINRSAQLGGIPALQGMSEYLYGQQLIDRMSKAGQQNVWPPPRQQTGEATPGPDQLHPGGGTSAANLRPTPSRPPVANGKTNLATLAGWMKGNPDDPNLVRIARNLGFKVDDETTDIIPTTKLVNALHAYIRGDVPAPDVDRGSEVPNTPGDQAEPAAGGPQTAASASDVYPVAPGRAPSAPEGAPGQAGYVPPGTRIAQGFEDVTGQPTTRPVRTTRELVAPLAPETRAAAAGLRAAGLPVTNEAAIQYLNGIIENETRQMQIASTSPKFKEMADTIGKSLQNHIGIRDSITKFVSEATSPTGEMKTVESEANVAAEVDKANVTRGIKVYNGLTAAADMYEKDAKNILAVSRSVLNTPGIYTGAGGELSYDINKLRAAVGDQKAALLQAALKKATATSVLNTIGTFRDQALQDNATAGKLFKSELDQIQESSVNLHTPLAANRYLVEVQTRLGEQASYLAKMARSYLDAGNKYLDARFDQMMSDYFDRHPLFTEQELAYPELVGAPTVPKEFAKNPAARLDWATKLGVGAGDPVRFPDHKYRIIIPVPYGGR